MYFLEGGETNLKNIFEKKNFRKSIFSENSFVNPDKKEVSEACCISEFELPD